MIDLRKFEYSLPMRIRVLQFVWLIVSFLFFTTYFPWPSKLKVLLLRLFGANVGANVIVRPNVFIKLPWNLCLGSNVWVGYGVCFDNDFPIFIGSSSCISQGSCFFSGSHNFCSESFDFCGFEIVVGQSCWVAAKCLLGPGSNLSDGTFLKMGSVVGKYYEKT